MLGFSSNLRYFVCCTSVDIRNGFDGLAGIVRNYLKNDPISGAVFIFLNKNRTHIKLLYWDGDGFALFYKRLERGRYTLPVHNAPSKEIKREELMMLLEGLSFEKIKQGKRFKIR
ncbi:MAG: IS66 family insertion sequence element accessory protein TnpB [Prolixibacteraceae bacterium]|nr:IS66 family insertion sequence element accessory protein TnpB [Prolixibacteraceae bacterium]